MDNANIIYSYRGEMSNVVLNKILFAMEKKMSEIGEKPPFIKKLNSILIECCQNLIHHSEKGAPDDVSIEPTVIVHYDNGNYQIETVNLVDKNKVPKLKGYMDKINTMTKEELRDYYQQVLTNGEISVKGGGGLGMLNIARKSKENKLHYSFKNYSDKQDSFTMSINV